MVCEFHTQLLWDNYSKKGVIVIVSLFEKEIITLNYFILFIQYCGVWIQSYCYSIWGSCHWLTFHWLRVTSLWLFFLIIIFAITCGLMAMLGSSCDFLHLFFLARGKWFNWITRSCILDHWITGLFCVPFSCSIASLLLRYANSVSSLFLAFVNFSVA